MTALVSVESQSLIDLARRLVASPHFRWLPGMRDEEGGVCIFVDDRNAAWRWWADSVEIVPLPPDLSDPATRGCVLQLVREAWGDQALSIVEDWRTGSPVWRANSGRPGLRSVSGDTEAAALVAALLAAPLRPSS